MGGLEQGSQAFVFLLMKSDPGLFERDILPGLLELDEIGDPGESGGLVQFRQVGVHRAGTHQVDQVRR